MNRKQFITGLISTIPLGVLASQQMPETPVNRSLDANKLKTLLSSNGINVKSDVTGTHNQIIRFDDKRIGVRRHFYVPPINPEQAVLDIVKKEKASNFSYYDLRNQECLVPRNSTKVNLDDFLTVEPYHGPTLNVDGFEWEWGSPDPDKWVKVTRDILLFYTDVDVVEVDHNQFRNACDESGKYYMYNAEFGPPEPLKPKDFISWHERMLECANRKGNKIELYMGRKLGFIHFKLI